MIRPAMPRCPSTRLRGASAVVFAAILEVVILVDCTISPTPPSHDVYCASVLTPKPHLVYEALVHM